VLGGRGDDELGSPSGEDLVDEPGNDRLDGGPGADGLGSSAGRDVLLGGPGRDAVEGGDGADLLLGGPGNDWLYVAVADADLGDTSRDRVRCGAGYDRVKADRLDVVAPDCEEVRVWGRPVRRR
jgi:Ca2+-binding RTX toxin-like protein